MKILNKNSLKNRWEINFNRLISLYGQTLKAQIQLLGQGSSPAQNSPRLAQGVRIQYLSLTRRLESRTGAVSIRVYLVGSTRQDSHFHLVGSAASNPLEAAAVQANPTGR